MLLAQAADASSDASLSNAARLADFPRIHFVMAAVLAPRCLRAPILMLVALAAPTAARPTAPVHEAPSEHGAPAEQPSQIGATIEPVSDRSQAPSVGLSHIEAEGDLGSGADAPPPQLPLSSGPAFSAAPPPDSPSSPHSSGGRPSSTQRVFPAAPPAPATLGSSRTVEDRFIGLGVGGAIGITLLLLAALACWVYTCRNRGLRAKRAKATQKLPSIEHTPSEHTPLRSSGSLLAGGSGW